MALIYKRNSGADGPSGATSIDKNDVGTTRLTNSLTLTGAFNISCGTLNLGAQKRTFSQSINLDAGSIADVVIIPPAGPTSRYRLIGERLCDFRHHDNFHSGKRN